MNNQEHMPIIEPEDVLQKRSTRFMRYLTISGLYISFFISLAALLLNWLIPAHSMVWVPDWLIQVVENNRIATLIVPLLFLSVCYWEIRDMTGDILAIPERYLDERQRMLRDQVHRSAYKILKCACLAVPVLILLCSLLLSHPAPVQPSSNVLQIRPDTSYVTRVYEQIPSQYLFIPHTPVYPKSESYSVIAIQPSLQTIFWQRVPDAAPQQTSWLNEPKNIGLFFSTFLISLFLAVSALPMALLAWRRKM